MVAAPIPRRLAACLLALALAACGPSRGAALRFDASLIGAPAPGPCATPRPEGDGLADLPPPKVWGAGLALVGATGSDRLGISGRAPVAFSDDGATVAIAQSDAVLLWDAATARLQRALPYDGPPVAVAGVTLSPDGHTVTVNGRRHPKITVQKVAGPDDAVAHERPLPQGGLRRSPNGQPSHERALSGDGSRAATLTAERVEIRDTARGDLVASVATPERAIQVSLSHDGRALALWAGLEVTLLSGGRRPGAEDDRRGPPRSPYLEVWDVDRGLRRWRDEDQGGKAWVFTRDGRHLVGPRFDQLDLQRAQLSGDGHVLLTPTVLAKRVTVSLWDALGGGPLANRPLDYDVGAVAASPDGRFAATGGAGGQVTLWDLKTHQARPLAFRHAARVRLLAFSTDGGLLASGGDDGRVLLMRTDTGARVGTISLADRFDKPSGAWFSPDGRQLLVATARGAHLSFEIARH